MLQFNSQQMAVFSAISVDSFRVGVAEHLHNLAPKHVEAMGQEGLAQFVREGHARAEAADVYERDGTRLWLELSMLWGIGFATDPTYRLITGCIVGDDPELLRMRRLHRAALAWQKTIYGEGSEFFRAALLRLTDLDVIEEDTLASGERPDMVPLLASLWPERARAAGRDTYLQLADAALLAAQRHHLGTGLGPWLCGVLALMLGLDWDRDPQYPWLTSVLADPVLTQRTRLQRLRGRARAYLDQGLNNGML